MVKYGCAWVTDARWRELETALGPTSSAVAPLTQREKAGKRIVRIVEQLPR
jgi:hypothetical protein